MSERKVINKYFPPDFDPAKIPRRRMPKDEQHKVRLMTPFSMRCNTCGDYIYKGKKFNARKERVQGEAYLGIQIFRFYIRCPRCSAEITFKTDPKSSDYVAEIGAQRNYEPWREDRDTGDGGAAGGTASSGLGLGGAAAAAAAASGDAADPMRALESRTLDSKREMDVLDALDEIRTRNAAAERLDAGDVLARLVASKRDLLAERERRQDELDAAVARAVFTAADGGAVRRILDRDDEADDDDGDGGGRDGRDRRISDDTADRDIAAAKDRLGLTGFSFAAAAAAVAPAVKRPAASTNSLGVIVKKARPPPPAPVSKKAPAVTLGLAGYGSDSDDEA
ncbi:hypothetical protein HK405_012348 [Cladochytrium tenue]|nr:hypothetical protein HK405_012348 [Cladochytrium tenue]